MTSHTHIRSNLSIDHPGYQLGPGPRNPVPPRTAESPSVVVTMKAGYSWTNVLAIDDGAAAFRQGDVFGNFVRAWVEGQRLARRNNSIHLSITADGSVTMEPLD